MRLKKVGSPDYDEEQVQRLLCRLEQTIPFPVDLLEFYSSLFPAPFIDLLSSHQTGVQERNLRTAVMRGGSATVLVRPDMYIRCSFAGPTPVPLGDGYIACPMGHPDIQRIMDWYAAADKFESRLSRAMDVVRAAADGGVMRSWQELMRAVQVKGKATLRGKQELAHIVSKEDKQSVDELLATALLLPDLKLPHAWVGVLGR